MVAAESERLLECTVCNQHNFELETSAKDYFFHSSEEIWHYHRCKNCGSIFLSPRPIESVIHFAYQTYYTHNSIRSLNRLRYECLKLNYIKQETIFFRTLHYLPLLSGFLSAKTRGLGIGQGKLLFDFGCGNGDYLLLAQNAGWDVCGCDFDANAVDSALQKGLNVTVGNQSTLSTMKSDAFDYITASHVLEHVYQPKELISHLLRMLKPGGTLWIETPNSEAFGKIVCGKYWRGLEAPRHLTIFSHRSIRDILISYGAKSITASKHHGSSLYIFKESIPVLFGSSRNSVFFRFLGIFSGIAFELLSTLFKRRTEFITLKCKK